MASTPMLKEVVLIDETNVYRQAPRLGVKIERRATPTGDTVPLGRVHGAMSHGYHRSLFSTTVATALRDRAIAY
ncbi:MAG TPA: hypothetical protein VFZ09_25260, partial [Archangium sp.]|uniref:hypothetical protein n=1 Tax=Archangium sp. TaxID=1872627 RepID=UPI002E354D11